MALWKKEMKVVKCNTRKILLTRHRSSHPPALSLQLPPPFLFTSHPSTKVQELRNWRTWYSTEHKEFIPKPRGGNKGDLKEVLKYPPSPSLIIQSDQMQAQGLVPEQKWHNSVSLGPICLFKSLSQVLLSPLSPTTQDLHTHSSHTHHQKAPSLKVLLVWLVFHPWQLKRG